MACQQFDLVADYLQIPTDDRERLKIPKRSLTVAVPIHRDDGSTQVFQGYRVQHHLSLGPTKGGIRFHPDVELGEVEFLTLDGHTAAVVTLEATQVRPVGRHEITHARELTVT